MPIRLGPFGGVVPKLHPERLPDLAAQTAQNVTLTRGVLEPISVLTPFVSLHAADGTLRSEIPAADFKRITKPDPPALVNFSREIPPGGIFVVESGLHYKCKPYYWLKVIARTWLTYVKDVRSGADVVETPVTELLNATEIAPVPGSIDYSEGGFTFQIRIPRFSHTFTREIDGLRVWYYRVYGPVYQFVLTGSNTSLGGPEETVYLPAGYSEADAVLPVATAPLVWHNNIYANFQVVDVAGLSYTQEIVPEQDSRAVDFPAGSSESLVTFSVDLNYVDPTRKHFYYLQTAVTAADEEGPASELSPEIIIRPGQMANISVPRPAGYTKNKVYRSGTGGDDFMLLLDANADTFLEDLRPLTATPLPPNGNAPACSDAAFLEGSVIHPAQYAVAFYENDLYPSDFYRFWSFPEEYKVPFEENIQAIGLSGNTVLVWLPSGKLYGVSGGNPAQLAKYLISENYPLLSKNGLCRLGGTYYYPTNDGLAAATGAGVEIVTAGHYTRTEWLALSPAEYTAKTADNSVFLTKPDGTGLRIDLEEKELSVSTYTATSGVSLTWKSRKYHSEIPVVYDYARITADGSVTLKVYADGVLIQTLTVTSQTPVQITSAVHARDWEFQFEANTVIREAVFYERVTLPFDGSSLSLTPAQAPLWENVWFKFPERHRLAAGILTMQGTGAAVLQLYRDGSTLTDNLSITNGRPFAFTRGEDKAEYWRVCLSRTMPIERLDLFAQTTVPCPEGVIQASNNGLPPWRLCRYEFPNRSTPQVAVVHCTRPVTMRLYKDGAVTASTSVSVPADGQVRLPDLGACRFLEFDFVNDDEEVSQVIIIGGPTYAVSEGVVLIRHEGGAATWMAQRILSPVPVTFNSGRLIASAYPCAVNVYDESDVLVWTKTVTAEGCWRVPKHRPRRIWKADIVPATATANIHEFALATSMEGLRRG